MGASYWIKLYHEVLNDPKMGRLPDRLWRRVVECFLLAGEQDEGGYLPSVEDMAWRLRCDPAELEQELGEIAELGILRYAQNDVDDGRWFVVKFGERQAAVSSTERVKRHRETKMKRNVTQSVSQKAENETDIDTDIDREREEEETDEEACNDAPSPWSVGSHVGDEDDVIEYHRRLSGCTLNKAQASLLLSGAETLGADRVCRAIKEWLNRGHKPWNVEGILDVARNGWKSKKVRDRPQPMTAVDYLGGEYADIIKH